MKNLLKSLAEFQQEVPVIHKGTQGYGYSYANLATIFDVINPILKKNKLGFTQLVGDNNIKTIIFHYESGEQLETTTTIPQGTNLKGMNDFQTLGSAITYIRRYALSSALGLITDKDTDASGEQIKPASKVEQPIVVNVEDAKSKLIVVSTLKELQQVYLSLPKEQAANVEVIALKDKLKSTLK
jgi:NADH/NAD ratio-sensing transcriptional regulator Rex